MKAALVIRHVYAIVRSPHLAKQEGARLREGDRGKDCAYVVETTRLVSTADS